MGHAHHAGIGSLMGVATCIALDAEGLCPSLLRRGKQTRREKRGCRDSGKRAHAKRSKLLGYAASRTSDRPAGDGHQTREDSMAYYEYKRVRDLLIESGYCDQHGNPANKNLYGDLLETDYDGNIHTMAADRIEQLENALRTIHIVQLESRFMGDYPLKAR